MASFLYYGKKNNNVELVSDSAPNTGLLGGSVPNVNLFYDDLIYVFLKETGAFPKLKYTPVKKKVNLLDISEFRDSEIASYLKPIYNEPNFVNDIYEKYMLGGDDKKLREFCDVLIANIKNGFLQKEPVIEFVKQWENNPPEPQPDPLHLENVEIYDIYIYYWLLKTEKYQKIIYEKKFAKIKIKNVSVFNTPEIIEECKGLLLNAPLLNQIYDTYNRRYELVKLMEIVFSFYKDGKFDGEGIKKFLDIKQPGEWDRVQIYGKLINEYLKKLSKPPTNFGPEMITIESMPFDLPKKSELREDLKPILIAANELNGEYDLLKINYDIELFPAWIIYSFDGQHIDQKYLQKFIDQYNAKKKKDPDGGKRHIYPTLLDNLWPWAVAGLVGLGFYVWTNDEKKTKEDEKRMNELNKLFEKMDEQLEAASDKIYDMENITPEAKGALIKNLQDKNEEIKMKLMSNKLITPSNARVVIKNETEQNAQKVIGSFNTSDEIKKLIFEGIRGVGSKILKGDSDAIKIAQIQGNVEKEKSAQSMNILTAQNKNELEKKKMELDIAKQSKEAQMGILNRKYETKSENAQIKAAAETMKSLQSVNEAILKKKEELNTIELERVKTGSKLINEKIPVLNEELEKLKGEKMSLEKKIEEDKNKAFVENEKLFGDKVKDYEFESDNKLKDEEKLQIKRFAPDYFDNLKNLTTTKKNLLINDVNTNKGGIEDIFKILYTKADVTSDNNKIVAEDPLLKKLLREARDYKKMQEFNIDKKIQEDKKMSVYNEINKYLPEYEAGELLSELTDIVPDFVPKKEEKIEEVKIEEKKPKEKEIEEKKEEVISLGKEEKKKEENPEEKLKKEKIKNIINDIKKMEEIEGGEIDIDLSKILEKEGVPLIEKGKKILFGETYEEMAKKFMEKGTDTKKMIEDLKKKKEEEELQKEMEEERREEERKLKKEREEEKKEIELRNIREKDKYKIFGEEEEKKPLIPKSKLIREKEEEEEGKKEEKKEKKEEKKWQFKIDMPKEDMDAIKNFDIKTYDNLMDSKNFMYDTYGVKRMDLTKKNPFLKDKNVPYDYSKMNELYNIAKEKLSRGELRRYYIHALLLHRGEELKQEGTELKEIELK